MGQLEGKTALVTGATSGIGRAIAEAFVTEGAHVYATGRRQAELDSLGGELGTGVTPVRNDVSDLDDLDRLYATIAADGRGLDIVVANAGGGSMATLAELSPKSFDETFASNVRGTVFTVQKSLPLLNPGAAIVVTGSTSTTRATKAFGVYSASKAALQQFVKVWAVELAERQVRVNSVVPGPTDTPGLKGLASEPAEVQRVLDGEAARVPLRRLGRPAEVADAVLFLVSDRSSFVTGTELFVDGGESRV
jgi:NAD(P)-dependent dehydrogenase (short-subunit alcohol dehydrogenase family)